MNRDLKSLDPLTYEKAVRLFAAFTLVTGRELFIVRCHATNEEQDKLYAQGRTAPGKIVTNAKSGQSWHNYGRAFDVALEQVGSSKPTWDTSDMEPWNTLGQLGKWIGLTWGGDFRSFKDYGHFEDDRGESLPKK